MRRRTVSVGLLVAMATALLMSAPSAMASNGADGTLRAQSAATPGSVLRSLMRLTKDARVKGKKIWSSDDAKAARKVGNQGRKAINFYCGQWVDYFKGWPYYASGTPQAVRVWGYSRVGYPAGNAYLYCERLLYWPILLYEPS